jgi:hypothetical protein
MLISDQEHINNLPNVEIYAKATPFCCGSPFLWRTGIGNINMKESTGGSEKIT